MNPSHCPACGAPLGASSPLPLSLPNSLNPLASLAKDRGEITRPDRLHSSPRFRWLLGFFLGLGLALLLVLGLFWALWTQHDRLLAHWPSTEPGLQVFCKAAGCRLAPWQDISAFTLEGVDLLAEPAPSAPSAPAVQPEQATQVVKTAEPTRAVASSASSLVLPNSLVAPPPMAPAMPPVLYRLEWLLQNKADIPLALPSLDLSLSRAGQASDSAARWRIAPEEWTKGLLEITPQEKQAADRGHMLPHSQWVVSLPLPAASVPAGVAGFRVWLRYPPRDN